MNSVPEDDFNDMDALLGKEWAGKLWDYFDWILGKSPQNQPGRGPPRAGQIHLSCSNSISAYYGHVGKFRQMIRESEITFKNQ